MNQRAVSSAFAIVVVETDNTKRMRRNRRLYLRRRAVGYQPSATPGELSTDLHDRSFVLLHEAKKSGRCHFSRASHLESSGQQGKKTREKR